MDPCSPQAPAFLNRLMQSVPDHLDRWAAETGDATAFTFLERGEREGASLSFAELRARSLSVAAVLLDRGLDGHPVLLVFPPGLDFIVAFLGCLYSGAIAVPAPYLVPGRKAERIEAIASDAGCRAVLSISALADGQEFESGARLNQVPWFAVDQLREAPSDVASRGKPAPGDIAFLQYTSGSTAEPRGVIITHGNLAANQAMIESAFRHDAESSLVSWLPIYHDMGLIGGVLQPLVLGRPAFLMSPLAFLQKPVRWLQAISRYRATTSGAPSFAYGLCARSVTDEQRDALNLDTWRVAFCGAEPVRTPDIDAFADRFAACGFDSQALLPCYGLAEATLLVSGGPAGSGVRKHRIEGTRRIAAGIVAPGQDMQIVDPETLLCQPDGQPGEIWLRGPHVGAGYWNRPEMTEALFRATLAGAADGPFYLRTGDVGVLVDGDLIVTGRIKDVIIIRGVKHHPEAIEETVAASHPLFRAGAIVAVGTGDARQSGCVILAEVARHYGAEDFTAAREDALAEINHEHGIVPRSFLFVAPATLPRTTSGKLQRGRCRQLFNSGAFTDRLIGPDSQRGSS